MAGLPLFILASLAISACGEDEHRPRATQTAAGGSAREDGGEAGAGAGALAGSSSVEKAGSAGAVEAAGAAGERPTGAEGGSGGGAQEAGGDTGAQGGSSAGGSSGVAGNDEAATGGSISALATGSPCIDDLQCAIEDLCATVPGATVSTCRRICSQEDVGARGGCGDGEVCAYDATGVQSVCQGLCSMGASGPEGCEAPDGCRFEPEPELTGGETVEGLCVRLGDKASGELCVAGECAEGLECIAPLGSEGHCEPHCNPDAARAEPMGCARGTICIEGSDGRSGCVQSCDPFAADGCDDGRACVPVRGSEELAGRCAEAGEAGQGEPCVRGDCQVGLLCTSAPSPFAGSESTCEPICQVGDASACGSGTCVQASTETEGVGTCRRPCSILDEGSAAGCAAGEWCAPTTAAEGRGICVEEQGAGNLDDACGPGNECGVGLYCECRFGADSTCVGEARCKRICIPGAGSADPGGCPEGQACALETDQGVVYAFGTCRDSCDPSDGPDCADSEELCAPSAAADATGGVCLDIPEGGIELGEDCTAPEHNLHAPCATMGLCEYGPGSVSLVCTALCRASEGTIGEPSHRDCADAASVCTEIRPGLGYGYCSPA